MNNIFHQSMAPVARKEYFYQWPYTAFGDGFEDVLILGAGSGTDVAASLLHGTKHIDAVEIDPVIVRLGREHHPDRPYDDPRVNVVTDDARHFLRTTQKKYDLVVFALIDSLTLQSSFTSVRLESYMFTEESFRAVQGPPQAERRAGHLQLLPRAVAGRSTGQHRGCRVRHRTARPHPQGAQLPRRADGRPRPRPDQPDAGAARSRRGLQPSRRHQPGRGAGARCRRGAGDRRLAVPLHARPHIPSHYLWALALVLVVSVVAVRGVLWGTAVAFSWHFFFLGVGFMLLETKSIIQFALLWGSTWVVASLAIPSVLVMAMAATWIVSRIEVTRPWLVGGVLLALLAASYALPIGRLAFDSLGLESVVYALLMFSPILCAGLLFGSSLKRTPDIPAAYGANLLGAMVGGVAEYLSLVTGFQMLLLVVAGCYLAALAARPRS